MNGKTESVSMYMSIFCTYILHIFCVYAIYVFWLFILQITFNYIKKLEFGGEITLALSAISALQSYNDAYFSVYFS